MKLKVSNFVCDRKSGSSRTSLFCRSSSTNISLSYLEFRDNSFF